MNLKNKLGVIGDGSWATALVKILSCCENVRINWHIREKKTLDYILRNQHNPDYLSSVQIDTSKINFSNDLNEVVHSSEVLLFVVPSVYFLSVAEQITEDLKEKIIISAVKGIIPENKLLISDYFEKMRTVPKDNYLFITGPCHAEEVALERLSYLTIISSNQEKAQEISKRLCCRYIRSTVSDDVKGAEYGVVLKNIYAIAAGMSHGLGYGDNFLAVLISNASNEMKRFIDVVNPQNRNILASAFLGDLLVTAYSTFSRNRTFGTMVGKGYSVRSAHLEMNMVAEGFYGSKCIHEMNQNFDVEMPIAETVYNIIYNNADAFSEFKNLEKYLA